MSQDGFAIPEGTQARKIFGWIVFTSVSLLLVIKFVLVPAAFDATTPSWAKVVDDTLGNIIATVLAGVILGGLVLWLTPRTPTAPKLEVLSPKDIGRVLDQALTSTRQWNFNGATGRWIRGRAMPELARHAAASSTTRNITVLLIDPMDEILVERYAAFRGQVSADPASWTPDRVRKDVFATVLAAYGRHAEQPQLKVQVGLKRAASVLRYDMSDAYVVVTREDSKESALRCDNGTFLYESIRLDIDYAADQSRLLDQTVLAQPISSMTTVQARDLLTALGLNHVASSDDAWLEDVLSLARSDEHPYS